MKIKTADGICIYCLPDFAKCKVTGQHPCDMDECPTYEFDEFGDVCQPEECEHYSED